MTGHKIGERRLMVDMAQKGKHAKELLAARKQIQRKERVAASAGVSRAVVQRDHARRTVVCWDVPSGVGKAIIASRAAALGEVESIDMHVPLPGVEGGETVCVVTYKELDAARQVRRVRSRAATAP